MPQRRFRWTGEDREAEIRALRLRAFNPLRHSPRRKPRDPEALEALARLTLRLVREDERFERIGPRAWRLVAADDAR
ncbi:MAG TPA: hypothetical protein VIK73_08835 [Limnochordales bacterium]